MTDPVGQQQSMGPDGPPPATEDIHLPRPTALPIIVAAGITVALVGVVLNPYVFVTGMVIWIVATIKWIREAREEIAELPLDHG